MGEHPVQSMAHNGPSVFKNTHIKDFVVDITSCLWHLLNLFSHSVIHKICLEYLLCASYCFRWQGYTVKTNKKKNADRNFCPHGVDLLVGKRQTINELIGKIYSIFGVRNTMETNKAEQGHRGRLQFKIRWSGKT